MVVNHWRSGMVASGQSALVSPAGHENLISQLRGFWRARRTEILNVIVSELSAFQVNSP